jgi:hypothetical protein
VCPVDPLHGQDPRCGGETLYTSNECCSEVEQSGTPPAAGASWWIHGMSGHPMRLLQKRSALSPSRSVDSAGWVEVRAQHGAAGGVSGVCDGYSPNVYAPLLPPCAILHRAPTETFRFRSCVGLRAARVAGNAASFSNMFFVVNMLFVMMLLLDCLVRVYGVRLEDTTYGPTSSRRWWSYGACIANPADCTYVYAARPSPRATCASL